MNQFRLGKTVFPTVSEVARSHGFSHHSGAFGATVHGRFSEMDRLSEVKSLHTSAQESACLSTRSQISGHLEGVPLEVVSDRRVITTDSSSQG